MSEPMRIPLLARRRGTKIDVVVGYALVDAEDYPRLIAHRWGAFPCRCTTYSRRREVLNGRITNLWMHREVLGLPHGSGHAVEVDHINHNGLNNRRVNLRAVTAGENCVNRRLSSKNISGVAGVTPRRKRGKIVSWIAHVYRSGVLLHGSYHATMQEAIAAHAAALALYESKRQLETA